MNNILYEFSVLMSVYGKDNPLLIQEAVESILNQTVLPSELLVAVDGPVPKEITSVLEKYKKDIKNFKIIYFEKNQGRGVVLQKVLPMCSFELVALADADDINLPYRFEKLLNIFIADDKVSAAGGYIQEIDYCTKKKKSIKTVPLSEENVKKYSRYRSPINHPTVMLKKSAVLAAGGYKPLYLMEDYFLWIRMINKGFKICNIPEILVNMRIDNNLYARRGGYKYFLSNKKIYDTMLELNMINYLLYCCNLLVRFTAQVLMPNFLRKQFYNLFLR